MIAIVLVGSTALLAKLNGTAKFQVHLDRETAEALAEAKAALIGYAVSDASRPGELPCPDANHDGFSKVPEDYSGPNCTNLRGWLPWKTLELPEMRDGSGEHLWYALSDRYHAGDPLPLNSETAGQVIVDGSSPGEVVAVVIAPGPPFQSQSSRPGTGNADTDDTQYLEQANSDADNTNYVSQAAGDFNDRLVILTRAELAAAVEKRVLGDVAQALDTYRNGAWNTNNVYPWLKRFENPDTSDYKSDPSDLQREGHLPHHQAADAAFQTNFTTDWNLANADLSPSAVPAALLTQGPGSGVFVPDSTGSCTWVDENTATCVGTSSLVCVWFDPFPAPFDLRCGNYGFAFNLPGTLVGTTAPALNDPRRRSVSIVDPQTPSASGTITFFQVFGWSGWPLSILGADSRTITIDGDTTGTVSVSGIQYDLGVPNELPQWFVDNNWHKLLYVGISGGHVGLGGGCNPGGPAPDCITVNGLSPPNANDKHAIVLSAGPPLTGQTRPSALRSDYFETDNDQTAPPAGDAPSDDAFQRGFITGTSNDQVRVIAP